MKFTINWLRQYIDFDLSPRRLAERLTMAGLEVEAVEELYPDLTGVVVARITQVRPHPNADRLSLCEVDDGKGRVRVVCGAPNAREGLVTALATPGTVMPGGLKIKPGKIRGELSAGMLCSAQELGVGAGKAGIIELPDNLRPGQPLKTALELDDTMIEVDLTPNRPDCASVIGIAREVGGIIAGRFDHPTVKQPAGQPADCEQLFRVELPAGQACKRYAARLIKGVEIGPSPWWLQRLLLAVGLRPVNNVVDITNFVMLEYGQPMHAFDFNRLAGGGIVVRPADDGEKIRTLDGLERELDPDMLLICDREKPVAVAGVMGAGNSEVSEETVDILLESACFDPVSVRRTSRKLKLATDSSYRFERGVDPGGCVRAMGRAVDLILEWAGGQVAGGAVDLVNGGIDREEITLRTERCASLLGLELTDSRVRELLESIEIPGRLVEEGVMAVTPPTWRVDLEREVDLIEEVARLIGYDEMPVTLPVVPLSSSRNTPDRLLRKEVASLMTAAGFSEAINYSFVSPKHFELLGLPPEAALRDAVALLNPLVEDQSIMRTTLLPGLLENVKRNVNFQVTDVRLFETGKVFQPNGEAQPVEKVHLAGVVCGRRYPGSSVFHFGQDGADIFDVKGVVESLLDHLRRSRDVTLSTGGVDLPFADPDCSFGIFAGDRMLGGGGRVLPSVLRKFGVKVEVYYFDLCLTDLDDVPALPRAFKPLARYPAVRRDLAVMVPEKVTAEEILTLIKELEGDILERAEIFDVYQGDKIAAGFKSVAVSVIYRSGEHTLEDEEVNLVHQKIIDSVGKRFGGRLREG